MDFFKDIERATFVIPKRGGQCVLINNFFILTAAHCVDFSLEGDMPLGNFYIEELRAGNIILKVEPRFVDPVSDIAILSSLDDQAFHDEVLAFEDFCDQIKPIQICQSEFEFFKEFPVYIYTHKKTWIRAKAQQHGRETKFLGIESTEQIERGTSGGPVVNDCGELVGIMSNAGIKREGNDSILGFVPRPHLTIPVWAYRKIFNSVFDLNWTKNHKAK